MQIDRPTFFDSPHYDPETGQLKQGAPQELQDEYQQFQEAIQEMNEQNTALRKSLGLE